MAKDYSSELKRQASPQHRHVRLWIVIQPRPKPAFHFGSGFAFALGMIFNLIFTELADGEIL
jgi:hypothetical protein